MGYDLYLRPATGRLLAHQFMDYFSSRQHFSIEASQAWYRNDDTQTYFVFEYNEQVDDDVAPADKQHVWCNFALNYFRPSYFAQEAVPELLAFIEKFDLRVNDPQIDGVQWSRFNADQFLNAWNRGNEAGYQSLLAEKRRTETFALSSLEIERVWRWNLGRGVRQEEIGDNQFVPIILFLNQENTIKTAAVWTDAIPVLLPQVDLLIIRRDEYAPRAGRRKEKDIAVVEWNEAAQVFADYLQPGDTNIHSLDYAKPPKKIVDFVKSLPPYPGTLSRVGADAVLNAELVAKYSAA